MTTEEPLATGHAALAEGRWAEARTAFEAALAQEELAQQESAQACFGLAAALWWLGENQTSVSRCARAYALFRRAGDVGGAVQCAVWLSITYKANFANVAAASGWIGRAERLLEPLEPGPLHGWVWVARAYRMADLNAAETLTMRAVDLARQVDDVDLELVALSQLGLIRVGQGQTGGGFALIDEAMAAALAGERSTLDTVVYTCCDMLNACELASDVERAAQWCKVADDFVEKYGCPFLYAECRIYYGSVLAAKGRWAEAELELGAGQRITEGTCPGLHAKALIRLAALRVRQGRLEEAEQLLSHLGAGVAAEAEEALPVAALLLARGDAPAASRNLEQRLDHLAEHRTHLVAALDLLVDAYVAADDRDAATATAQRLADLAGSAESDRLDAVVAGAQGRVSIAWGDPEAAIAHLEAALRLWSHRLIQKPATTLTDLEVELYCHHVAEFDITAVGREADSHSVELGDPRAGRRASDLRAWLVRLYRAFRDAVPCLLPQRRSPVENEGERPVLLHERAGGAQRDHGEGLESEPKL